MLNFISQLEKSFAEFISEAYQNQTLCNKSKVIVLLTFALSEENPELVKEGLIKAKQEGLTNEEIAQIEAIVIALKGRKIVHLLTTGSTKPGSNEGTNKSSCCCQ
ncbi:hypothetical protein [Gracilinema caldarium]|uniref:Carboxymuconolactone decarboxylase family n=1 Tax=Gracilinema caldarium (strain ATCC 51460 / DSM 7334 / H1) TaxID=744872 RepID=F8F1K1_GRAC1|nr:hypothetical protein [Gracilinema caldarium]AEJ19054.1 carboxymuconolactone decarboxylase family [Gracilinema caldarium DSM 7334]